MSTRASTKTKAPLKSSFTPVQPGLLQRKCACGNSAGLTGECSECQNKQLTLQRRATDRAESAEVPPIVHEVLNSPGQPLDPGTRAFMEPRFGYDFSQVRVHTDAKAADSAQTMKALAYTVKRDIVFGTGQYRPETNSGKRLLAHELTHVVQQEETTLQPKLVVGSVGNQQELEANDMARAVTLAQSNQRLPLQDLSSTYLLQRQAGFHENTEEASAASVDNEDIDVHDGDFPAGSTVAISELSDMQAGVEEPAIPTEENVTESFEGIGTTPATAESLTDKHPQKGGKKGGKQGGKKEKEETPWIKKIDVDLAKQKMQLIWSDERPPENITMSSGKGCPNTKGNPCESGDNLYCTPTGDFLVGKKGDGDYKSSQGDSMSWYVEFVTDRGIGIHNSQTADGIPRSHGCVRVGKGKKADDLARKLNQNVNNKTTIHVHSKAPTKAWSLPKAKMKSYKGCPEPPEPKLKPTPSGKN